MRLIRNSNGCYARHYVIEREISKFKSKCLERRTVEDGRKARQMFVYDLKILDPILYFAAAMIYSKIR